VENGFPPGCENIRLPPAPKATCSQTLQVNIQTNYDFEVNLSLNKSVISNLKNKIIQVLDRMNAYNYSINNDIKSRKKFKNPSIYEKLIEAHGIDEYGSSFPTVSASFLKEIFSYLW
jgi:hypothetical protein